MLRDHFHSPLHPRHAWESFHAAWLGYICESLNDLLPKNYFAQEQVHAGRRIEIDVGTYEQLDGERESNDSDTGGGVIAEPKAKLWTPPAATASIPAVFAEDFEIQIVESADAGLRIVGAVELASPGNKDRDEARLPFAAKVASYLASGVSVVVVDICTSRLANLHHAILPLLSADEPRFSHDIALYSVAYRPVRRDDAEQIDIWTEPLGLGRPLPTMPLWLNAEMCVPVELGSTYRKACERRRIN